MGISSALGSSALLPAGLGFRNKLINGGFDIWQRGTSSFTTNGAYTADRWVMGFTGTGTAQTVSQVAFTAGNPIPNQEPNYHIRNAVTGGSGSSSLVVLTQKIEDVRTCAGQQVAVSFWAKVTSGTASLGLDLYQDFGSGGSATVGGIGAQKFALTTSWQKFSALITVSSISGKTIGANNFLACRFWFSSGSDYNSLNGTLGIQSNTFDIWGVQLEQNYQPTPFEQRPFGIELSLCQRYYEKSYRYGTAPGTATFDALITMAYSAAAGTSGELGGHVMMNTYKRIPPNITWYDHAGNINKCTRLQAGVANHANQSVVNGATGEHYLGVASVSGAASTCAIQLHFVAECEL